MSYLGIDVGSTTVKTVLTDENFNILKQDYRPHNTKQAETLLNMLKDFGSSLKSVKNAFITGSGASRLAPLLNAKFIQEVNAVTLCVQKLHKEVNSVVELGGQDAKIIHFKPSIDGKKRVESAMNDKCASGTGATIERCTIKVGLEPAELADIKFSAKKLHPISAKCGVFAETDIVNLLKASIPKNEIINSLADAIVLQNLTVLSKGNTLKPKVLLLGGPNKYLPFLQDAWRFRISEIWDERGVKYDKSKLNELIFTPKNAEFYAALGAIYFGAQENGAKFKGIGKLEEFCNTQQKELERENSALVKSQEELDAFLKEYRLELFVPKRLKSSPAENSGICGTKVPPPNSLDKRFFAIAQNDEIVKCYLGVDGGSTSSKAVLIDGSGEVLFKAYQLSLGNPIEDILKIFKQIEGYLSENPAQICGFGVTGYAADVLESALGADANIIETIAHLKSTKEIFGDSVDVICDVGGQDIKVLFLQNGMLKNFRLSNQCSAGNGALLQSMAKQFGVKLKDFAKLAFSAKRAPNFNYGCAVFLDTDRVNFQKEGYTQAELFAGIAKVLPKNIWQYIVQAPSIANLGKHFVLQGGTQHNLAALKAQVDYIKEQIPDAKVSLHPHCAEAGAIGAALEARDAVKSQGFSKFAGLKEALKLQYSTKTDSSTKCRFCPMECNRTFIDTKIPSRKPSRYISGFKCEKGTVESLEQLQMLKAKKAKLNKEVPNLAKFEEKELFNFEFTPNPLPKDGDKTEKERNFVLFGGWGPTLHFALKGRFKRSSKEAQEFRKNVKIAIPRVLNIYSKAPFFVNFLKALGVDGKNIYFSKKTNQKMFLKGSKFGSVDPCFPAKVVQAHVYSLLFANKKPRFIWNPAINEIDSFVDYTMGYTACPIVSGTPRVVYSAFVKERNYFSEFGVEYIDDTVTFTDRELLAKQLFKTWGERLKITEDECRFALTQGLKAQEAYLAKIQEKGRKILENAEQNGEVAILLLGRPYHLDSGINHDILGEFQALGFKILTINSIPKDESFLEKYFKADLEKGLIESVFDIRDVWQENFSTNSAQKVWAAKFAARAKNIAVVDISSFKCGHDAPTYAIIDKILSTSRTPHLMLHDLDANKPMGSINIRIKTFAYALREKSLELRAKGLELTR